MKNEESHAMCHIIRAQLVEVTPIVDAAIAWVSSLEGMAETWRDSYQRDLIAAVDKFRRAQQS